ncbi:hypothetical protein [Shewanella sp. UCD-KL21]|uniref:hypothetical protein n=1 Tax=Shewanella sp. UCD-KL21 TaxID=1917164 RepID=UPI001588A73E|nr:hypothetical protein [Shewanella sp. UCD-KL21]
MPLAMPLVILAALYGAVVSNAYANDAIANNALAGEALVNKTATQCRRNALYSIYLNGIHTGEMTRTEHWHDKSAVVTSNSEASILGIGTQYQQRAELSWSDATNEWLTNKFHQQVSGFRSRDMQVTFDDTGRRSRVDIDGEVANYVSKEQPLRDVDTLAIQIREHLLQGRQQFALVRQASDGIEPYQFYVQPKQTVTLAPWGDLTLIPVEQTGDEDVTYYFAADMDYQLIKARYHGIILNGLIELDSYTSSCESGSLN